MSTPPGAVLWVLAHEARPAAPPDLLDQLLPTQRERVGRLSSPAAAVSVAVACALQNHALRAATGEDPAAIEIRRDARDKPYLPGRALHFSLSHSSGCAACLTASAPCGVDAEPRARRFDPRRLGQRILAPAEQNACQALDDSAARRDFILQRWTLKEAWLKALGTGIAGGPQRCAFAITDTGIRGARDGQAAGDWQFGSTAHAGFWISWAVADRSPAPAWAPVTLNVADGACRIQGRA